MDPLRLTLSIAAHRRVDTSQLDTRTLRPFGYRRLVEDYAGPFDPDVDLSSFSHRALARIAREYMLVGHIFDRVGLPQALARFGADGMQAVAIDEWMGASPVYTERTRRAFGIDGDDVGAIFKSLQLDVGAPHQYMDFAFRLDRPDYGEFWLEHCGALMDVEPMGEDMVYSMCHDIEDPTFDATAVATNPRARMRPIHRPPRDPAGRHPHCHWRITIDPDVEPVRERAHTADVRASRLAGLDLDPIPADAAGANCTDYSGAFDPDFELEDLSQPALVRACKEFAIQVHLLVRAYMAAVAARGGADVAQECARAQLIGTAWIVAERIGAEVGVKPDGVDAPLKVMQLHPVLAPAEYAAFRFEKVDANRGRVVLADCEALREGDALSWFALIDTDDPGPLAAIAGAVSPHTRVETAPAPADARRAWELTVDPSREPVAEPPEAMLGRVSGSADWQFRAPRSERA